MLWLTVRVLHQPSSKGTSPQPMPSLQDPERASGQGRHKLNSAGCKWARGPFRSSLPKYADRESTALLCSSVSIYNDVEKWLHVTCTLHSSLSWYYDIVDDVCVCVKPFSIMQQRYFGDIKKQIFTSTLGSCMFLSNQFPSMLPFANTYDTHDPGVCLSLNCTKIHMYCKCRQTSLSLPLHDKGTVHCGRPKCSEK